MNFEIGGRLFLLLIAGAALAGGQGRQTMHPVVFGRSYAVASLKPQATQVAERVLRSGGNAFDAAVAGQAVLGLTDASMNGIGGDAEATGHAGRRTGPAVWRQRVRCGGGR